MKVSMTIQDVRAAVKAWRAQGLTVGLVPTMGYLHEGHQSLIARAAQENDRVVVSVFVNPIQFGPAEDLESYPRDFAHDCALCEETGASLVFHPDAAEMYPDGFCTYVDMDNLTKGLCGASRPIHFRGVCTVVAKLFHIVNPDRAYFGQKDAQQLAVIKRMARDLSMDTEVVGCPIVREPDGLAKSSRNSYLSPIERQAAVVLSRALDAGKAKLVQGERSAEAVKAAVRAELGREPLAEPEYVELVRWDSLEPVGTADGPVLCAIAVRIGKTRLIDNFLFGEEVR